MDWTEPRPLIVTSPDGATMKVVEETAAIVAREEKPAVVVAIAGRYRTGKSFLMNKLAGRHRGFALGDTVQSKTKGIWVWVLPHPTDSKKCLILLDTEGLGDVEQVSSNYDTWIFVLAMLLSSMLVFNTTGNLDRTSLEQLHFVANMSEHVQMRAGPRRAWDAGQERDAADCRDFFPAFVVCVRDFLLRLEIDGRKCSSDEYLEHCLQQRSRGLSKECRDYNAQREMLRSIFQERKCFVFPLPTDPERMHSLDEMESNELKPGFTASIDGFYEHVVCEGRVKHLKGTVINGRLLVELARVYVDAQANGAIPCIEQAVSQVAREANTRAHDEALGLYRNLQCDPDDDFPARADELAARHVYASDSALDHFGQASVLDRDHEQEKRLTMAMAEVYEELVAKNKAASVTKARTEIDALYQPIKEMVSDGTLKMAGGFKIYEEMMQDLQKTFRRNARLGDMAPQVLGEFLASVETEGRLIMQMDASVSQLEQERIEKQRAQERREEQDRLATTRSAEMDMRCNLMQEQMRLNQEAFDERLRNAERMTNMRMEDMRRDHQQEMDRWQRQQGGGNSGGGGGGGGRCSVM